MEKLCGHPQRPDVTTLSPGCGMVVETLSLLGLCDIRSPHRYVHATAFPIPEAGRALHQGNSFEPGVAQRPERHQCNANENRVVTYQTNLVATVSIQGSIRHEFPHQPMHLPARLDQILDR